MDEQKCIYRLDDQISFRTCSLYGKKSVSFGDCTSFETLEENWRQYYSCCQYGIHFHCTKHPEIEFDIENNGYGKKLSCKKCRNEIEIDNFSELINECLRMLNIEKFKDAKLIRLDDWYVPEVKQKESLDSGYWINTNVKTDKDGDTMIVVYVGHKDSSKKAQFFIKPEKLQLSSDHKDMDPAKVLAKIEVTLKDRLLSQKYFE